MQAERVDVSANDYRLVALRQRFEKYTSPVTNAGGVK